AVMGSFAADHLVGDQDRFAAAVRAAVDGARAGSLMTVGMRPTRPETGYGYVQYGDPVGDGPIRRVRRFREKPDHDLAVRLVESGDYLWNAGMFIWRVEVFLAELARQQPALHDGLVRIAAAWDTPQRAELLVEVWPGLPRMAVEYAVMEDAARRGLVATVSGDFGWTDIGDFRNLSDLLPGDAAGNVVLPAGPEAQVQLADARGVVVVPHGGRLVSVLGVEDLVVVDTPDVVLVCARDRAQDVKKLVDDLKAQGATGYL
ncbi:MAG: mannose-1-phosphate guanylyltransferase, partial [Natronosporangium sp.]